MVEPTFKRGRIVSRFLVHLVGSLLRLRFCCYLPPSFDLVFLYSDRISHSISPSIFGDSIASLILLAPVAVKFSLMYDV